MSLVLLAPVSYLTHALLTATQCEQEKKSMMPPKVCAWRCYDATHTQLVKVKLLG